MASAMKYKDLVDYDKLDPYKEECIRRLAMTLGYLNKNGARIVPETIGETAVAIEGDFLDGCLLAFGVEGLGTKNKIVESMAESIRHAIKMGYKPKFSVRKLYSGLGICNQAMSLNDLCGIGAIPLAYEPVVATGSSDYLTDPDVSSGLIDGFVEGARLAGVAVPGGETPTLPGVVYPNTVDMAGGSIGIIRPKSRLCVGDRMRAGLSIYGIASSGIHSNGVSLARKIAEKSKNGYFTRLSDGRTIGEALLTPTKLYADLISALAKEGADIIYGQPITGHGFGKIMRKKKDLTYAIEHVPDPQEEFKWLQENGPVDDREAYSVWNMRVGFVLFAKQDQYPRIKTACEKSGHELFELGNTKRGKRKVVVPELNLTYQPA